VLRFRLFFGFKFRPVENQYDSYHSFLSRKEKTGEWESSPERVDKGIDRRARLR
jgi:hypothetical protein